MFDVTQPIAWQVIVGTILAIFAVTAVGIWIVKSRCEKER